MNIGSIQAAIDAGKLDGKQTIDVAALKAAGLVGRVRDGVRLLASGVLKAKVNVEVSRCFGSGCCSCRKAKGTVTLTAPAAKPYGRMRRATHSTD